MNVDYNILMKWIMIIILNDMVAGNNNIIVYILVSHVKII